MPVSNFSKNFLQKDVLINIAILALVVLGLFLTVRAIGDDQLRAYIESAGVWAPVIVVIAKATTIIVAPLGGAFIYPLAGALFGFSKALPFLILGDLIGSTVSFWISRLWGRAIVERFFGNTALVNQLLSSLSSTHGFFVARVTLIMALDLLSYVAGLTRLPFLPFIIIHTAVGLIPTVILTLFGSSLIESGGIGTLSVVFFGIGILGAFGFALYLKMYAKELKLPE